MSLCRLKHRLRLVLGSPAQDERDKRRAEREKDDEEALVGGLGKKKGAAGPVSTFLGIKKASFFNLSTISFATLTSSSNDFIQGFSSCPVIQDCIKHCRVTLASLVSKEVPYIHGRGSGALQTAGPSEPAPKKQAASSTEVGSKLTRIQKGSLGRASRAGDEIL